MISANPDKNCTRKNRGGTIAIGRTSIGAIIPNASRKQNVATIAERLPVCTASRERKRPEE